MRRGAATAWRKDVAVIAWIGAGSPVWVDTVSPIPLPRPTVSAGDLMIATITVAISGSVTISPPAGWTLATTTATASARTSVYTRVADIGEPSTYSFTWSSGAYYANGQIVAYRNATEVRDAAAQSTSASDITYPAVTAVAGDALVTLGYAGAEGATAIATPSGMTERVDAGGDGGRFQVCDLIPAPGGSTGTRTAAVTGGSGQVAGISLALIPA